MKYFFPLLLILLAGCGGKHFDIETGSLIAPMTNSPVIETGNHHEGTNISAMPPAPTANALFSVVAHPAFTSVSVASVPVQPSQFVIGIGWNLYTNLPACPWATQWIVVQFSSDLLHWSAVWMADTRWGYTNAWFTNGNPQGAYRLAIQ